MDILVCKRHMLSKFVTKLESVNSFSLVALLQDETRISAPSEKKNCPISYKS